jgi:HSP20 family protein
MDRLFEGSFVRMPGFPSLASMDVPTMDICDTKDNVEVKVTVPGVKPEDLDITITGDVLTIKGESKAEQKVEKGNYVRQERRYGAFQRSVQLPGPLIADKAEGQVRARRADPDDTQVRGIQAQDHPSRGQEGLGRSFRVPFCARKPAPAGLGAGFLSLWQEIGENLPGFSRRSIDIACPNVV